MKEINLGPRQLAWVHLNLLEGMFGYSRGSIVNWFSKRGKKLYCIEDVVKYIENKKNPIR